MNANLKENAVALAAAICLASCASSPTQGMQGAVAFGKFRDVMDQSDKDKSVEAIRANKTETWTNASSGNQYTFTPTRTFTGDMGICRDYRIDAMVGGSKDSQVGTACTGPRGFWEPTNVK